MCVNIIQMLQFPQVHSVARISVENVIIHLCVYSLDRIIYHSPEKMDMQMYTHVIIF